MLTALRNLRSFCHQAADKGCSSQLPHPTQKSNERLDTLSVVGQWSYRHSVPSFFLHAMFEYRAWSDVEILYLLRTALIRGFRDDTVIWNDLGIRMVQNCQLQKNRPPLVF